MRLLEKPATPGQLGLQDFLQHLRQFAPAQVAGQSRAAKSRIPSRSDSARNSQSAGLLLSVFRSKLHSFLEHGAKEMVADLLFFLETTGRDGDQSEGKPWPEGPHRAPEFGCRLELLFCPFGYDAQIHVVLRAGLAASVRTKEVHRPHRTHLAQGFKASGQRFSPALQRGRQIFQQQSHLPDLTVVARIWQTKKTPTGLARRD